MLTKIEFVQKKIDEWNTINNELIDKYKDSKKEKNFVEYAKECIITETQNIYFNNIKDTDEDQKDCPIGFYLDRSFNGHYKLDELTNLKETESWDSFQPDNLEDYNKCKNPRSNYGVCDNYKQILNLYPELIENNTNYIVLMTPVFKEHQSSTGGWRWHKWGPYIGDKNPICEYLYDEPDINLVFVYNIYEVEEEVCLK